MNQAFGVRPIVVDIIIGVTCLVTIWGGLKRISAVMSKAVPIMAVLYVAMGLGVIILNYQEIPRVVSLIVTSAFSPTAAVGGFAGATVKDAIQYGVARGIYSNDAGTGYGMIAHASARTDHPVRQSLWGWGEVFLDTIIICSITAFTIIMTGSYTFGDSELNHKLRPYYMIYYMVPCVIFYNLEADILWAFTDILSALYVLITIFIILAKHREIFRIFDDFWQRYLPAKKRGENPEYVSFDCSDESEM